jgi:hypothetical protein
LENIFLGESVLDYLELNRLAFGLGPSFDFTKIDGVIFKHQDGLFQTLPVTPVVIGSQPVFYTISGRDNSQGAGGKME